MRVTNRTGLGRAGLERDGREGAAACQALHPGPAHERPDTLGRKGQRVAHIEAAPSTHTTPQAKKSVSTRQPALVRRQAITYRQFAGSPPSLGVSIARPIS